MSKKLTKPLISGYYGNSFLPTEVNLNFAEETENMIIKDDCQERKNAMRMTMGNPLTWLSGDEITLFEKSGISFVGDWIQEKFGMDTEEFIKSRKAHAIIPPKHAIHDEAKILDFVKKKAAKTTSSNDEDLKVLERFRLHFNSGIFVIILRLSRHLRSKDEVDLHRIDDCFRVNRCVSFAADKFFLGFSCIECPQNPRAKNIIGPVLKAISL